MPLLLLAALAYVLARPRLLTWGATRDEAGQSLPGDEYVPRPTLTSTRAVTVDAPPDRVWPWLVQIGDGRGGLYSYDWLDRRFGFLSAPSATTILPEHQNLAPGDVIPLGRGPDWPVALVDPERTLVLRPAGVEVSWCFHLKPLPDGRTRLISRVRGRVGTPLLLGAIAPAIDLPWFLMERRMLLGIAERAAGFYG